MTRLKDVDLEGRMLRQRINAETIDHLIGECDRLKAEVAELKEVLYWWQRAHHNNGVTKPPVAETERLLEE